MIQTISLVKQYKNHRAVDGLDLEVRPGEIVGLLGPNGAGKTTALRCISGILRPSSGRALINGHDIVADQANAKKGLAFVPEVPSLYELLTVDEHLRFVAMAFNCLDVYEAEGAQLLARYTLTEKRKELVATLSKGMRQKLSVACAMVHRANTFLFDEPLIGVDPSGAHEFKQELMNIRARGGCILISTHLLDTAEKLCDRVVIMAKGRRIAQGTMEELRHIEGMAGLSLEEVFLKLTEGTSATTPSTYAPPMNDEPLTEIKPPLEQSVADQPPVEQPEPQAPPQDQASDETTHLPGV